MKRKIIYTDAPPEVEEDFKYAVRIEDFLPPPDQFVLKTPPTQIKSRSRFSILRNVAAL
ncbi:MAG: hypothetical protein LBN23_02465 [Paludibacter sp.]|jgi:hypothetical protein|nr:hypothetical protein [Paludibacter sp.]